MPIEKNVQFANKMIKFLNHLSDVSKEWYLTAFIHVFVNVFNFLNKLGLLNEFQFELDDFEKMALSDVIFLIKEVEKIRQEVLNK